MASRSAKSLFTLVIDDRGGGVWGPEGKDIGRLPDSPPGAARRSAWAEALRNLVPMGSDVQLLLGHGNLTVQCQEVPFLTPRERQDAGARLAAGDQVGPMLATATTLDADPTVEGGHVLWVASLPQAEMHEWLGAIQAAGLNLVYAVPIQRALTQGIAPLLTTPTETEGSGPHLTYALLVVEPGQGRLLFYRGASLLLMRSFRLPDEEFAILQELLFEEINRTLQFIKQKYRGLAFDRLMVLGLPELGPGFQKRIATALRLKSRLLGPELWPVLARGIAVERARKDGLNLVPIELQDALRRQVFKGVVWSAALLMLAVFLAAGTILFAQEAGLRGERARAEALLVQRQRLDEEGSRVVQARLPLLRARMGEYRQAEAAKSLADLTSLLMQLPEGIQLERLEISQIQGDKLLHRFQVTGIAFTERSFSVGPLARYLSGLGRYPGLSVHPVAEVSVSDRMEEGKALPDRRAVTRFTLEGTAP